MARARELVRQCVLAGYAKLHLDASMRLAGDPGAPEAPLDAAIATERTAELCAAAEQAHAEAAGGSPPPLYVIGTDVPAPGGEVGEAAAPGRDHRRRGRARQSRSPGTRFAKRGLESAVGARGRGGAAAGGRLHQHARVRLPARAGGPARRARPRVPGLVFEAHSTDYQRPASLRALVADRFAVLKVGPRSDLRLPRGRARPRGDRARVAGRPPRRRGRAACGRRSRRRWPPSPRTGAGHHAEADEACAALRAFGFSDRVRYYWPAPAVRAALGRLFANLRRSPPPLPLAEPVPAEAVRGACAPARCPARRRRS